MISKISSILKNMVSAGGALSNYFELCISKHLSFNIASVLLGEYYTKVLTNIPIFAREIENHIEKRK